MNRLRLIQASAVALATCLLAGTSFAGHHEGGGEGKHHHHGKHFDKRDSDGDGSVSKAEWMAAAEARFDRMDADGDGVITREEYQAAHKAKREGKHDHHGGH